MTDFLMMMELLNLLNVWNVVARRSDTEEIAKEVLL